MYSISVQIYIFWKSHPISSDFIGRFFFEQIFSANFRILRGCGSMAWRRIGFKLAISLTLAQLILVGTNDIYIYMIMLFSRLDRNNKKRLRQCRGKDVPPFRVLETTISGWIFGPRHLGCFGTVPRNGWVSLENIYRKTSENGCLCQDVY